MIRLGALAGGVAVIASVLMQTPVPPAPPVPPAQVQGQQPVRDPGAAPQKGTSAIVGTVTTMEAGSQPIRRATVTVSGGGLRGNRQAVTDGSGRFVIADLPSGTFTLSVSKPSYITTLYGSKPGQPGALTPIVLAAGAREVIDLKMPRGAVIAGMVFDQYGRPRPQIRVQAWQYRTASGQRRLQPAGNGLSGTDDRGAYRIYGLPAGDFIVLAVPQDTSEIRMITPDELRWAQAGAPSSLAAAVAPPPPSPGPTVGLAPIYFPGAADINAATTITLNYGEERQGVDFQLQSVPTARVEGSVLDSDGRVAREPQLRLFTEERLRSPSMPSMGLPSENARFDSNSGKFTFLGVAPGRYTIVAQQTIRTAAQLSELRIQFSNGAVPPASGPVQPAQPMLLWAMAQVDVNGRDVSNITLTLQPGLAVSGRVAFEATTSAPPADASRVRLTLSAIDPPPFGVGGLGGSALADGTFTLRGAMPGRYRLTGTSPPGPGGPWVLKSVVANGRDALDAGFDLQGSDVAGAVMTFTDKVSEISGSLTDAAGAPAKDLWVLCFSTDRTYWTPQSRRTRLQRPNPDDGKFRFTQWVPGEYFLVAVMDGEQIDLADQATLDQIAGAALRITLAEGQKLVKDLRVAR